MTDAPQIFATFAERKLWPAFGNHMVRLSRDEAVKRMTFTTDAQRCPFCLRSRDRTFAFTLPTTPTKPVRFECSDCRKRGDIRDFVALALDYRDDQWARAEHVMRTWLETHGRPAVAPQPIAAPDLPPPPPFAGTILPPGTDDEGSLGLDREPARRRNGPEPAPRSREAEPATIIPLTRKAEDMPEAGRWPPFENGNGVDHDEPDEPLPIIDLSALDGVPVPPREWLVPDLLPLENVGLLTGHGASGKTQILLQLGSATVLGRGWLNHMLEYAGPALIACCEDDKNEIHRRIHAIARLYGTTFAELAESGLVPMSFAGKNAVLAAPDRRGILQPTPLFNLIRKLALEIRPRLIGLDNAADVYAGNENERQMVRQFITMLRGLAIEVGAHVLLTLHPSLTGISTGTGMSGNTAWFNSVRAQLYLKPAEIEAGVEHPEIRELTARKNQYGPLAETTAIHWRDGVFVLANKPTGLQRASAEQRADEIFLALLIRFCAHGRHVSSNRGPTFAPAIFAAEPGAQGVTSKGFAAAMSRLFEADRIHTERYGPPSHQRSRLRPGGAPA